VLRERFLADLGHATTKVGADATVFDDNGRILLVRRADDGLWGLPAGWVEPGEHPSDTVTRELREELGVDAPVTHRWAGLVGYGEDALPRCGAVPGSDGRVLAFGGYNGTGHVQAWVAAGIVAATIAGGAPAPSPYAPLGA